MDGMPNSKYVLELPVKSHIIGMPLEYIISITDIIIQK
jgi:hypothetical protein